MNPELIKHEYVPRARTRYSYAPNGTANMTINVTVPAEWSFTALVIEVWLSLIFFSQENEQAAFHGVYALLEAS